MTISIWTRIGNAISALTNGQGLSQVLEQLKAPPERSVAFTIAVIALGAKMAKADGLVTRDEVAAFRQVFFIPEADEKQAASVFNLARQDVAGYDVYATKIGNMFRDDPKVLEDLIEGLFHIAMADGFYHPDEDEFMQIVAEKFRITQTRFRILRARFVPETPPDAYDVLGVTPDTPLDEIRAVWRKAVRETHPDRLMARGLPEEAITLATKQLIALNRAWEEINNAREPG